MYILILKYILIALCLAYITHVFSKKREVMIDVKRHVLEKRLNLYASLHELIHHNSLFFEPIMRWADSYMSDETLRGCLSRKILFRVLGDRLSLVSKLAIFVETLAYIHVSDRYSPSAYFTMDEDSRIKASSKFLSSFYLQLHHNR